MSNDVDLKRNNEVFKNRLNELCKELSDETNIKKSKLPNEIGIDYSVFSMAINYGIVPKPIILMKIADYFNISIEYLLCRTDDEYFSKAANTKTFHERFDELRKNDNYTYYAISKKIHICKTTIAEWNRKKYIPELNNLLLLTDLFNTSIDYLLGRTDDKSKYELNIREEK